MNKKVFLAAAMLATVMSANAIRAVHKLFPQRQSDGTTVMLYTNGNGHFAFYTTADDQVVVRNSEGTLCYGELKDGELVASGVAVHDIGKRTAEEIAFVAANTLKPNDKALAKLFVPYNTIDEQGRRVFRAKATSTSDGLGKYGASALGSIPSIGTVTIPVILVEYSDVKLQETTTMEKYSRFMNEEGYHEDSDYQKGSVRDYFRASSNGMFNPVFDVVAKVSLSKSYKDYGYNSGNYKDLGSYSLFKDAVNAAAAQGVDFSKYYVNNTVPGVVILYAGYGEATGGDEYTIWPHSSELPYYQQTVGDYRISSYFMGNELSGSTGTVMMGMGVMVHELGHNMGLPDFYDVNYTFEKTDSPMGGWSVMDDGPYYPNNTAYAPVGYTAYERSYMGWQNIRELKDAESVTLTSFDDTEGENAVMLRNPSDESEYFIFENRAPTTWSPAALGTGLLTMRVAFNKTAWQTNNVNIVQDKKRAMVVTANGRKITSSQSTNQNDLFGNGVNNITSLSLYAGTTVTDSPIYKILKTPEGKLTFNFKDRSLATAYASVNDDVYEKVTDVSSLASNDEIIFVCEDDGVALTSSVQDNRRGAVAVKIEDGKAYGNDYVQPFTLLMNSAGQYGFRANSMYLSASNQGIKTSRTADKNCIADIAIADGNASVTFTGTATCSNMGYSMDEVGFTCFADAVSNMQIYRKADPTGISTVNAGSSVKTGGAVYNLSGQQVGDGYKGIVIIGGKKVLRK